MEWRDFHPARRFLQDYVEGLIVAVAIAVMLRAFVISAYSIPSESMAPTLQIGDFVFDYKLPFGVDVPFTEHKRFGAGLPHRGDIVVFRYPGNESVNYIKRVVGLPGDKIQIQNNHLFINNTEASYKEIRPSLYEERFGQEAHTIMIRQVDEPEFFGPAVVPPDSVFVLGDNRNSSDDSRYWGTVPVDHLEGRAFLIWLSLDWNSGGRWPHIRWDRVFQLLH